MNACSLKVSQWTLLTVCCSMYDTHWILLTVRCSLYAAHCTLLSVRCSLDSVHAHWTCTAHCALLVVPIPGPVLEFLNNPWGLGNKVGIWLSNRPARAGFFKQSMGARNRVVIALSYRPVRLHRLAEFIPRNRFLGSINVQKYGSGPHRFAELIPWNRFLGFLKVWKFGLRIRYRGIGTLTNCHFLWNLFCWTYVLVMKSLKTVLLFD